MEERKRLTFLGFTESQKSCKSCSVHVGCRCPPILPVKWRHRAPSHLRLSSPGRKVNAESLVLQGISMKKRVEEKERKKIRHGVTKLHWARLITLFSKRTFITWLYIEGYKRCKVIQSKPKHYTCFAFIEIMIFSAYLSHKQCCVHYLLVLEACQHFMTLFW